MKILITGMKASGKSYLYEHLSKLNLNLMHNTLLIDAEMLSFYDDEGRYNIDPALSLLVTNSRFRHVIVTGAAIASNLIMFDRILYLIPKYSQWKEMFQNRIDSGRVNSALSSEPDSQIVQYTEDEFNSRVLRNLGYIKNKHNMVLLRSYDSNNVNFIMNLIHS